MSNHPDFSRHNYQVVHELGRNREGGRITYLANHLLSEKQVVIKQFRFVQEGTSWQGYKAYEREIQILQELEHSRIPRYLDSFETRDGFCMIQEYKEAPSLAEKYSFSPEAVKQIAISVLEILVYLQKRVPPIIHRDIKPENILVDRENNAYLIDFGLARINNQAVALSSVAAGTPGFMPPEAIFNRPLTEATDLYSLGATLICLLTNTRSVNLSNLIDENYRFNFRHLVTRVNPRFINWLQKMVEPNYKDRYGNAAEALAVLETIDILDISTNQPKPSSQYQLWTLIKLGIIGAIALGGYYFTNLKNSETIPTTVGTSSNLTKEQQWFKQIKPRCNSVEVVSAIHSSPPPNNTKGIGYGASCYALAGKIQQADELIQQLPKRDRVYAAEVVFNIGHPVADAGDDRSAGPIMNLVLKYWPENYMALYHAGMSAYILEEYPQATQHLQEFLQIYQRPDGWRKKAMTALENIKQGIPADKNFSLH